MTDPRFPVTFGGHASPEDTARRQAEAKKLRAKILDGLRDHGPLRIKQLAEVLDETAYHVSTQLLYLETTGRIVKDGPTYSVPDDDET